MTCLSGKSSGKLLDFLTKMNASASVTTLMFDNFRKRHFTIRGAEGTDFEGGIYHGRILVRKIIPA
jgi:ubiquitin-protein ligase